MAPSEVDLTQVSLQVVVIIFVVAGIAINVGGGPASGEYAHSRNSAALESQADLILARFSEYVGGKAWHDPGGMFLISWTAASLA